MAGFHDVSVKVVSQKGICFVGHKVGDEWLFGRDMKTPGGLCTAAFIAIFPHVRMLQGGGGYNPEVMKEVGKGGLEAGTMQLCCNDPENPLVLELRVVK